DQLPADGGVRRDAPPHCAGSATRSMRHGVDNVIDAEPDSQRRVLLRVLGVVGVLPGVAEIHVVADGDHEAAFVVVDSTPARCDAIMLPGLSTFDELRYRHLITLV